MLFNYTFILHHNTAEILIRASQKVWIKFLNGNLNVKFTAICMADTPHTIMLTALTVSILLKGILLCTYLICFLYDDLKLRYRVPGCLPKADLVQLGPVCVRILCECSCVRRGVSVGVDLVICHGQVRR